MQEGSFMTVLSRQDSRDFSVLVVVHRCQDPTGLLVTAGSRSLVLWCMPPHRSPMGHRGSEDPCAINSHFVPGGKMPDVLK